MRKIIIGVAALLSVAAVGAPASAAPEDIFGDMFLADSGAGEWYGNRVDASCQGGPGAALDLNYVTYAVRGVAQASSTRGALPIGTTVTCWIKDTVTGIVYGPAVTGGAPGGTAVSGGTIRAKSTGNLRICTEAYAIFNDNQPPAHYKSYGC